MMRTRAAAVLTTLLALGGLTACASSTSPTTAAPAGGDFWAVHAVSGTEEVDRPASVTELAQRSDVVVLGHVTSVAAGRDYTQPGKPADLTQNVTITGSRSQPAGASFVLEMGAPQAGSTAAALPKGDYVFYLTRWYVAADGTQVYNCTSPALCVIGGAPLTSVRAPEALAGLQGVPPAAAQLFSTSATAQQTR